jgi:hypothetical protein
LGCDIRARGERPPPPSPTHTHTHTHTHTTSHLSIALALNSYRVARAHAVIVSQSEDTVLPLDELTDDAVVKVLNFLPRDSFSHVSSVSRAFVNTKASVNIACKHDGPVEGEPARRTRQTARDVLIGSMHIIRTRCAPQRRAMFTITSL